MTEALIPQEEVHPEQDEPRLTPDEVEFLYETTNAIPCIGMPKYDLFDGGKLNTYACGMGAWMINFINLNPGISFSGAADCFNALYGDTYKFGFCNGFDGAEIDYEYGHSNVTDEKREGTYYRREQGHEDGQAARKRMASLGKVFTSEEVVEMWISSRVDEVSE